MTSQYNKIKTKSLFLALALFAVSIGVYAQKPKYKKVGLPDYFTEWTVVTEKKKFGFIDNEENTGGGEFFAPNLKIYPNPFTDAVRITGSGTVKTLRATSLQVQIINASGVVVHTQKLANPDETIRLEHLPAGVYFFIVEMNEGTKERKAKTVKVVKE